MHVKGFDIKIQNINKNFGNFNVLDNVSITIKKGEFFSLLGPSGCGKTTLLRMIAGFDSPESGTILFDNNNICDLPPEKRDCNTVFQSYALFNHLNVFDNIAFPLRLKKVEERIVKEKVNSYIKLVQLEGHENKKPTKLSGGQRQRVAIARALINEPSVLLLDEPLSALDAKLRQNLLVELDTIHDKVGITFIYVTHDQSEALSVSDRIAVMNKGQILQVGTPYEIYESPSTDFVAKFIGETNLYSAIVTDCFDYNDEYMIKLNIDDLESSIWVTSVNSYDIGKKVTYTIRPEKIRIRLHKDNSNSNYVNHLTGIVDEPLYSGFQSKFFVLLQNETMVKVFKQHVNYMDEGPLIKWKDNVFLAFDADDGYIVENKI